MTIMVPEEVYEQLEAIRRSGKTNMGDRSYVQKLAYEAEFHQAVVWLEENPDVYAIGFMEGIEPCQMVEGTDYLVDSDEEVSQDA